MQRARRLVAVMAVTLVGSLVLAGCQSDPTIAAYVGNTKITEEQVSKIVDDYNRLTAQAAAANPGAEQQPPALDRVDVLTAMVLHEGCAQLAQDKSLKPASTTTAADFASQRGMPADSQYAILGAELVSCMSGVPAATAPPTEAELRELYDRALAAGMLQEPVPTFDQIKDRLAQDQSVQQAFAAKQLYTAVAGSERVVVNPRYRPLTVQAFQNAALLPVTIGGSANDAVFVRPANPAS